MSQAEGQSPNGIPPKRRLGGSVKGWIVGLGAIAGAITAVLVLIFTLFPDLTPCIGDATAELTDVDLLQVGPREFQLSYSLESHGYEGESLGVRWSLRRADGSGNFRVVPGFGDLPAATLEPQQCSTDQGGADIDIPVTKDGKYLVELEVFPPEGARITRKTTGFTG